MRIFFLAVTVFCIVHFVRTDLTNGTIPLAAFFDEETSCIEETVNQTIAIRTVDGDTIDSLLALYPDPNHNFLERLEQFYKLNPHLKLQEFSAGEQIILPVGSLIEQVCDERTKS